MTSDMFCKWLLVWSLRHPKGILGRKPDAVPDITWSDMLTVYAKIGHLIGDLSFLS